MLYIVIVIVAFSTYSAAQYDDSRRIFVWSSAGRERWVEVGTNTDLYQLKTMKAYVITTEDGDYSESR